MGSFNLLYDWCESITCCTPSYIQVVSCPHLLQNCVLWFLFQKILWHLNPIEGEVIEALGSGTLPQQLCHLQWLQLHLTEVNRSNRGDSRGKFSSVGGCEIAANQNEIVNLPCVKHWEEEGTPLTVVHAASCQVQNWDLENFLLILPLKLSEVFHAWPVQGQDQGCLGEPLGTRSFSKPVFSVPCLVFQNYLIISILSWSWIGWVYQGQSMST